jgi:hypothetical protein
MLNKIIKFKINYNNPIIINNPKKNLDFLIKNYLMQIYNNNKF